MLKILTIISLLSSINIYTQNIYDKLPIPTTPKATPDTLYFAFNENIQLIIINHYDTWKKRVDFMEQTQPMAMPWSMKITPSGNNTYIFRNKKGEIVKTYNTNNTIKNLKNVDFINASELDLISIEDYRELNNHLKFYKNGKSGLINLKGEIVVPAVYDEIRKYQDRNWKRDKLVVVKDNKFGFLDSNLKVLFPPIYQTDKEYLHYPPEHYIIDEKNIRVLKDGKYGLISEDGKVLIDFEFDDIKFIHDSMYIGLIYRNGEELDYINTNNYWDKGYQVKTCIVFNKDFDIISKLKNFEYILYYGIKSFIVKKNNKFGVVNHLGKVIVPLDYDSLIPEESGYRVSKNNKSGIVNYKGKVVIPLEYDSIDFYGEAIYVTQDNLIGVYNRQYKLIAKPQFESKTWDWGKYILTRKNGESGFVNHQTGNSYYQSPEGEIIKL